MKFCTVWVTRKEDDTLPELICAWDEHSIDENPEGYEADIDASLVSVGNDISEIRYIWVDVGRGIEDSFKVKSITGRASLGRPR